jgi:hypothetical protein
MTLAAQDSLFFKLELEILWKPPEPFSPNAKENKNCFFAA